MVAGVGRSHSNASNAAAIKATIQCITGHQGAQIEATKIKRRSKLFLKFGTRERDTQTTRNFINMQTM